jgi:hypothetical protein
VMNILVACGKMTAFYRNKPNTISRDQTSFSAKALSTSDSGLEFTQNGGICMKYSGILMIRSAILDPKYRIVSTEILK